MCSYNVCMTLYLWFTGGEDTADDSDDDEDIYFDTDESLQPTQGEIQGLLRKKLFYILDTII